MRLAVGILITALGLALAAPAAPAGTFSSPVPLPGQANLTEWHVAVNDRGEGAAVQGTVKGEQLYPLSTSGTMGAPVEVLMPRPARYCCLLPASVAMSDQGQVALGLRYSDGTDEEPFCEEHCGWGCCGQVAVASWRLGQQAPPAQTIRQHVATSGEPHQIVREPAVLVGPRALTVLWVRADVSAESHEAEGEAENDPQRNQTQLEEAYARFGEPFHVKRLVNVPKGIYRFRLAVAGNGAAAGTWIEDGNKLVSVRGGANGDLSGPLRVRFMPSLTLAQGFGFGPGDEDTLSYFSNVPRRNESRLLVMTSSAGQRFSPARRIGTIPEALEPHLAVQASVPAQGLVARRGRSLLAAWARTFLPYPRQEHMRVRRGSIGSHLGPVQTLGLVKILQGAFIDEHGRSVIIYGQLTEHAHKAFTIGTFAVTALPGHRFGRPISLFPQHQCAPTLTRRWLQEPIIAISSNGHAIVPLECENRDYLVGYTP